jgi:hypothetical protein
MTSVTPKADGLQPETETAAHLFDNWFDPIESGIRERVRGFIDTPYAAWRRAAARARRAAKQLRRRREA